MSGDVVYRRALSILGEHELPETASSDVLAALEDSRPGTLYLTYDLAQDAKLERDVALDRCAAIYFNHSAGQVCDDIADGDCRYLEDPTQTLPGIQYILHSLFFATLARAKTRNDVVQEVASDLVRAAGAQQIEVRTQDWTAALAKQVAIGLVGDQYASYFRILWSDSVLESSAAEIGRDLGIVLHVGMDIRQSAPRFTTLSPADAKEVTQWALERVSSLRARGIRSIDDVLAGVQPLLEGIA